MHEATPLQPATHEQQSPASVKYGLALDVLQTTIPEIAAKRESIDVAGQQLITDFGIEEAFFDDPGRSLVFAAAAERAAQVDDAAEGSVAERTFINDVVALAANKYSPLLKDARLAIESEQIGLSEDGLEAVYDRYTDKELSAALNEKVKNGDMLSATKKRLGITPENEDPYEVRVISIATHEVEAYGLRAPIRYDEPSGDRRADKKAADAKSDFWDVQLNYSKGLLKRADKMSMEIGKENILAPAWVTTVNGKRFLCLSMPLAEKINTPSLTNDSKDYKVKNIKADFANIAHEYVHTQGHLNVDQEFNFGISLEELRAEEFSGNQQGYMDIKGFFVDYKIITGENPRDVMDNLVKGGKPEEIMASIANRIGIARMLEVVLSAPKNYIDSQSSTFLRGAYEYLGGFDGVIGRLIDDERQRGGGEAMEARITERAHKMAEILGDNDGEWLWDHRRHVGLNAMTDLVNKRAEELGVKQPKSK